MSTYLEQVDEAYEGHKKSEVCNMDIPFLHFGALLRSRIRQLEALIISKGGKFTYRSKHRGFFGDTLYNVEITGDYYLLSYVTETLDGWMNHDQD